MDNQSGIPNNILECYYLLINRSSYKGPKGDSVPGQLVKKLKQMKGVKSCCFMEFPKWSEFLGYVLKNGGLAISFVIIIPWEDWNSGVTGGFKFSS